MYGNLVISIRLVVRSAVAAVTISWLSTVAPAADFIWNVNGDGAWNGSGNWSEAGFPVASDNAFIRNVFTPTSPVTVTVAGGVIREVNNLTLDPIASPHELFISNNTDFDVHGDISNGGLVTLNSTGNSTLLRADGSDAVISGSGRIVLGAGASGISSTGDYLWTNSVGHTIEGAGNIGGNAARFVNNGLVLANNAAGDLVLDPRVGADSFMNNATVRATGGGTWMDWIS